MSSAIARYSQHDAPVFAIVPTYNRHNLVATLTQTLASSAHVIIVDNGSTPPISSTPVECDRNVTVLHYPTKPPQLYAMWTAGLREARRRAVADSGSDVHTVAVLNDDAIIDEMWLPRLVRKLRTHPTAVIATTYAHKRGTATELRVEPSRALGDRMCPWAFVARGESLPEPDTDFHWWWGDTDLEWRACRAGGVLLVPGDSPRNALANTTTVDALAQRAGVDGEVFARKWGGRPW